MALDSQKGGIARSKVLSPGTRTAIAGAGAQARWAKADPSRSALPQAVYGSKARPLVIGEMSIPAYVLDDERRVLTVAGMTQGLSMAQGGSEIKGLNRFELFISRERIRPFISDELATRIYNPVVFLTPTGGKAYGYEADILVELCEAVLKVRDAGKLQEQQKRIAQRCEQLVRGLARVGIVALVDEATGYQAVRRKNDLQRILEAYISKDLLPWTRRFPQTFYEEIYRLLGWTGDPASRAKPAYIGKLTNALVYERLPDGVLPELKGKNPVDPETGRRRFKHHQLLTDDIGNPHLEKHLSKVIGLMQASDDWSEFKRLFRKVFKTKGRSDEPGRGSVRI